MVKITIHRGSREIGGNCVELSSGNTTILIDIGEPLAQPGRELNFKEKNIDAVLVSHPHLDHYGQLRLIPDHVPVYTGELTKKLMDSLAIFTTGRYFENSFVHFHKNNPFRIGNFKITPLLVDHSAYDSYCFLIEVEGKKIVYSGDFRSSGYKGFCFDQVLKNLAGRSVDALLMEGTCLDRVAEDFPGEIDVSREIERLIGQQENVSLLIASSTNYDRIISASLACDNAGKVLAVDIYSAWIMEQMKTISKAQPLLDRNHVKVLAHGKWAAPYYARMKDNPSCKDFISKIYSNKKDLLLDDIKKNPAKYLLKISDKFVPGIVSDFGDASNSVSIIYSMWRGYDSYCKLRLLENTRFYYAHTSGHAPLNILQEFAARINPAMLIPMHTDKPQNYPLHFANVCQVEDGKTVEI